MWETENQPVPLTLNIALEMEGAKLRVWPKTHMGYGCKEREDPSEQRKVDFHVEKGTAIAIRADTHHAGHRYRKNYRMIILFQQKKKEGGVYIVNEHTHDDNTTLIDDVWTSDEEAIDDPYWSAPSEPEVYVIDLADEEGVWDGKHAQPRTCVYCICFPSYNFQRH